MQLLDQCWPYLALFGTLFFTGIGLPPLPEEVPIVAAGIATNREELLWWAAWVACVAGVLCADVVLYGVGRLCGPSLFSRRWAQRLITPERHKELEIGFGRRGLRILLLGRLLPGCRTAVFLAAGAMRYPFVRFFLVDGFASILGVGLVFFGGYLLAESFTLLLSDLGRVQTWLLVVASLALTGYWVARLWRTAGIP